MRSIFTTGVATRLLYGLLIGAWTVIIANVFALALALCSIVMKVRFR